MMRYLYHTGPFSFLLAVEIKNENSEIECHVTTEMGSNKLTAFAQELTEGGQSMNTAGADDKFD